MDFNYTPEQEEFRRTIRSFLERTKKEVFGASDDLNTGTDSDQRWAHLLEYHRRLYKAGYVALHWPKEWGGGGANLVEQAIYQDEALRLGLPIYGANTLAIDRIGPTPGFLGNDEQRHRYLPKMLTAEEILVPGILGAERRLGSGGASNPGRNRGDYFVVNGQKTWTSLAQRAHMQVLLVRTDPKAPKHMGISYLLVDMKSPGITVRPLRQMNGGSEFNEVFYDNLRVPLKNLVGEINKGWQVLIATLMYERASGGTRHPVQKAVEDLLELSRHVQFEGVTAAKHPYVRQKLAQFAIEADCLRLIRYRGLTAQIKKRIPGPETSYGKLHATELNLRVQMFADELLGPFHQLRSNSPGAVEGGRWLGRFLTARGMTIAAGSSEIQHNIIGERVLKLPKG